MSDEKKSGEEGISGGIRQGLGVLAAFKDAIEETLNEARERGDLSAERAKEIMKGALDKAQEAAGEARERGREFVSSDEFDGVREVVGELKERVQDLERRIRKGLATEVDDVATAESAPEGSAEEGLGGEDSGPTEDGNP